MTAQQTNNANDFVWLKEYPPGVAHTVDPTQYRSLAHFFETSLQAHSDKVFSVCMDREMTYAQVNQLSGNFGAWLQSKGLPAGSRVAIMLPNVPQFAVVMMGIIRAGYTCVNVNPLYTARELEHQLKDSGASAIVVLENFGKTLSQALPNNPQLKHIVVTAMGDLLGGLYGHFITFAVRKIAKLVPEYELKLNNDQKVYKFKETIHEGSHATLKASEQNLDSIAFLQYTGGTTGLAKGAILTHSNVIAATLQIQEWFEPVLKKRVQGEQLNFIGALPLYHIFALAMCLISTRGGNFMTLIPNPRDMGKFIKDLSKRPFHVMVGVNTLFNGLLNHPSFKSLDFSHLYLTQAGGMATSRATAQRWKEVTGSTMVEGWGMSENCAAGTDNPVTNTEFTGTIGLPFPGNIVEIKDDEGRSLPMGQMGELCIKGPNVMKGYYNQEAETQKAFTADGFMRTGDLAVMNERGYFKIVDRKKDMIIVSGFNVFPNELEDVIVTCPGVLECAVIGVPDANQGEAVKAFIVKKDPNLTIEQVKTYCAENLTGYKKPKHIEFIEALPKTNVGKILRRELRGK